MRFKRGIGLCIAFAVRYRLNRIGSLWRMASHECMGLLLHPDTRHLPFVLDRCHCGLDRPARVGHRSRFYGVHDRLKRLYLAVAVGLLRIGKLCLLLIELPPCRSRSIAAGDFTGTGAADVGDCLASARFASPSAA